MSKKKSNIVELNGKKYDATTGELLHAPAKPLAVMASAVAAAPSLQQPLSQKLASKKPVSERHVQPVRHHAAQRSETLMRHVVKKPVASARRAGPAKARTDVLAKQPAVSVAPKLSIASVDAQRLKRAHHIPHSTLVSRFPRLDITPTRKTSADIIPKSASQAGTPVAPAPVPARTRQPSQELFERAMAHANSHRAVTLAKPKHTPRRAMRGLSTALAIVLLSGFIAYQNAANFRMHLASNTAGFAASLPGYKPSGFGLGKISYSPGLVSVNFHSNSDASRNFAIIEKISDWNSQTLHDDFVASARAPYQTVQAGGRTVYILNDNTATWVSGGVWYQVQSHEALSTQQLVKLAASM